jgi:hypothetical protein
MMGVALQRSGSQYGQFLQASVVRSSRGTPFRTHAQGAISASYQNGARSNNVAVAQRQVDA